MQLCTIFMQMQGWRYVVHILHILYPTCVTCQLPKNLFLNYFWVRILFACQLISLSTRVCTNWVMEKKQLVGCPKKTKSPDFGTQLTPVVFIGQMSHQKNFSIIDPYTTFWQQFLVLHCNYNGEIGQKFDFVITFDWRVLLT